MPTPQFYPTLASLVDADRLPEPIKTSIENILERLFYKTYYTERSSDGAAAYHYVRLVFQREVGLNLLGGEEGFELLFNPGSTAGTTEVPISIYYNLPILRYVKQVRAADLNSIEDYFDLILKMFDVSKTGLLYQSVETFLSGFANPIDEFINQFNTNPAYSSYPPLNIPGTGDFYTDIEDLITQLDSRNINSPTYVLTNYVEGADLSESFGNLSILFESRFGVFTQETIIDLFIPIFSVSIPALELALAFPRTWLKPVDAQGEVIEDDTVKSLLTYNAGSITYHSEKGFEFINPDSFDLTPSQIGNTGLLIDIDNLKFDFRTDKNIPEADADGRPNEFQGIYAGLVSITLPSKWFSNVDTSTLRIVGRNLLIGTGGISGTIALETLSGQPNNGNAFLDVNIGSWEVKFNYFDLTFHQNVIIESNIGGELTIPKLEDAQGNPALIDIQGGFNESGDFNLTASEPQGIPFTLFDFVTFNLTSVELGRLEDDFYIGASCEIWFENPTINALLKDQKISIPKIRVYDNGRIEIVGGNSFIPTNISLDLGPVEMAVTGIHFGSYQGDESGQTRNYNYWGFDGAISVNPLGVDVRGEGVKYYYTVDNDEMADEHGGNPEDYKDSFIRIQSLELDMVIPGSASPESALAIIHGALSIDTVGESTEYTGEISLKLPQVKISGGASMKLQPDYPAFVVDAFINLPAPIPIGPLGIYGFRGLLGYAYVAKKEAVGLVSGEDTWYEYYTYPPRGIHVSKFIGPPASTEYDAPFSIGAGAVLGTSFDGGTTISVRAMLVLSLPTLFMIDGRASILSARLGLDGTDEPPFFAFIAWGDNSIEMGMGADFDLPAKEDKGWILDLYAEVQAAFFFNNPSAWYVNFGTKAVPVSASVLTLFEAQTYLMLSAQGIETGARAEFNIDERFGPARVKISAYVEVGGHISFERPQIGGYVAAGGRIIVDVFIIKVDIGLDAIMGVEAAKPFLIYAELRVRGCIDLFFGKICASATIKLKWEFNPEVDRTPIAPLPNGNQNQLDRREDLVKGVHMLTNDAFVLDSFGSVPSIGQIDAILPMDSFVDIKVTKGMIPNLESGKIGGYTQGAHNYTDLIPPDKTVRGGHELRQVKHKYSIENIEIKANDGSGWVDYQPFKAVVAAADRDQLPELLGYWQKSSKQYNTIRLLASNPFSFTKAGEPGWFVPEQYGITPSELFCEGQLREPHCLDFLNKDVDTVYHPPTQYIAHYINGAYFTLEGIYYANLPVTDKFTIGNPDNPHGFEKSLQFENQETLIVLLPEASIEVRLKLTTDAQGVAITYFTADTTDEILPVYTQIHQEYKTAAQLDSEVVYANEENPIKKILINPTSVDLNAVKSLQKQIAHSFYESYANSEGGVVDGKIPSEPEQYQNWLNEIDELNSQGCQHPGGCEDSELCDFYHLMLQQFYSCFVFPDVTMEQIRSECFQFFIQQIEQYAENNPTYNLIEYLQPEYGIYHDLLKIVSSWGSEEEIDMRVYTRFRNIAYVLLEKIKELGECDCGKTCNTNERLCYLFGELTILYQTCFLSIKEPRQVRENIPCFELVAQVLSEDILESTYPFPREIIEVIVPLLDDYRNILDQIRRASEEEQWSLFFHLKEVFETILLKLEELGNCDCEEPDDDLPGEELNCRTSLQQLCWMTVEDYEFNETIPGQEAINAEYEAMVAAVENTAQPIWRPNTHFYIHFQLRDEVDNGESQGIFDYYYGFKTVGPVGYYHKHSEVDYLPPDTNPARFPLTSLSSYIDYKRSYPNANGNLLKAKPLFYGNGQCRITLFFIKPMVYHMLNPWNEYNGLSPIYGELNIAIKDPMSGEIIPYPLPADYEEATVPVALSKAWKADPNPLLPMHLQLINNIIDYANGADPDISCTPILGDPIVPNSPNYVLMLTNLKPEKLYTALVYNAFDKNENGDFDLDENEQVHEFVFKTSRYKNFREQVESFNLSVETEVGTETSKAVYEISKGFAQSEIDTAYQMVSNPNYTGDADLERQFYHLFDRVFEGVLGFTPLAPPTTTEFNSIVNINTGETIALLIRNPEPFNNPKIPVNEIEDTLRVMVDINSSDNSYKILHSRDYSQAIIMNNQKNITAANLNFLFEYKIWNGSTYLVEDEQGVPDDEKLNSVYVEGVLVNPGQLSG